MVKNYSIFFQRSN